MSGANEGFTDADEKALAMLYAYTALVKSLVDQDVLSIDVLHGNMLGATLQLERIGETGAAEHLRQIHDSLERFGKPI